MEMVLFRFVAPVVIFLSVFTASARAATVTVAWDASPEATVTGYRVWYGTSPKQYSRTIDVGSRTDCLIADLEPGQVYYFAVQAYDSSGLVSAYSPEIASAPLTSSAASLSLTSLTTNVSAPQPLGGYIGFAAAATGGAKPYEYEWLLFDGASWRVVEDWSLNGDFIWTPAGANANYRVAVNVRSAQTADGSRPSVSGSVPFAIGGPQSNSGIAVTSLTADKSAPQSASTRIAFTATGVGPSS